jgi:hypothetical protein
MMERMNSFLSSTSPGNTGAGKLMDLNAGVESWCKNIESRLEKSGVAHKWDPNKAQKACEDVAQIKSDPGHLERQGIQIRCLDWMASGKAK